jgi:hypothetical protein
MTGPEPGAPSAALLLDGIQDGNILCTSRSTSTRPGKLCFTVYCQAVVVVYTVNGPRRNAGMLQQEALCLSCCGMQKLDPATHRRLYSRCISHVRETVEGASVWPRLFHDSFGSEKDSLSSVVDSGTRKVPNHGHLHEQAITGVVDINWAGVSLPHPQPWGR